MQGSLAVVILAAGKSTRFKSQVTKTLHPLCGKPLLEYVLDAAAGLSPAQLIVVYGPPTAQLLAHFGADEPRYAGHRLHFVEQAEALGTGHALLAAESALHSSIADVLVLPGDTPLLSSADLLPLLAARKPGQGAETPAHALLSGHLADPAGYGRILRADPDAELAARIVEDTDATDAERLITEVNSGMYLFSRRVFDDLRSAATTLGASANKGEYYLPDVVQVAPTVVLQAPDFAVLAGINDRAQLAAADAILQARIKQRWMREGVTFILPETSYVTQDVELAPDVEIGPGCMLLGATRVGQGTHLVQGCWLKDAEVGAGCRLHHVRAELAVLEDGVRAGPYSNLRPGTRLRSGVRVGNFVETKKADVGAGSKLPHLTYVGDATLGAGVNVGAGTIFCNYDGVSKNHTTVGDGVFIGSNSSLQAPLSIGAGAYIAMASAITHDVPAGALAVARARQENKEGYAEKIRSRTGALAGRKGSADDSSVIGLDKGITGEGAGPTEAGEDT